MIENKRIVKLDENQFRSIIYESIRYALLNEMVYGNEGSGFNQNNKYYGVPPYSKYCYFGDCRNTVDGDEYYGPIWDATQMSGFLLQCKIIDNDKDKKMILNYMLKAVHSDEVRYIWQIMDEDLLEVIPKKVKVKSAE